MDKPSTSLFDILSIDLILRQAAPYLPISALLKLAATDKSLRNLIYTNSEAWRYLDLSRARSTTIDTSPIDAGGISWRAERMDEALTEDDFYSGPLRGIFSKLHSKGVLGYVQTLILDGLSVPADLVREIIAEERFNIRILSLRECKHLNQTKLQQVLRYAVRPGRPDGTPKLRGLYIFGLRDLPRTPRPNREPPNHNLPQAPAGVLGSEGAQIGSEWNLRSSATLYDSLPSDDQQRWYDRSGRVLLGSTSAWADTLSDCEGIIAFDAVLCRGPRHDITTTTSKDFLKPTIAGVALGQRGCETCGNYPEGPAVFGRTDEKKLPLLAPPPLHASTVRAAQRPETTKGFFPPLIVRCEDCLRGRWCERCNRSWCETCYQEPVSRTAVPQASQTSVATTPATNPPSQVHVQSVEWSGSPASGPSVQQGPPIKKIGVHRDCFGCGRTCEECRARYMRTCRFCRAEYCVVDNEGSSDTECDWCNQGGRRTRELF